MLRGGSDNCEPGTAIQHIKLTSRNSLRHLLQAMALENPQDFHLAAPCSYNSEVSSCRQVDDGGALPAAQDPHGIEHRCTLGPQLMEIVHADRAGSTCQVRACQGQGTAMLLTDRPDEGAVWHADACAGSTFNIGQLAGESDNKDQREGLEGMSRRGLSMQSHLGGTTL